MAIWIMPAAIGAKIIMAIAAKGLPPSRSFRPLPPPNIAPHIAIRAAKVMTMAMVASS